MWDSNPRISNLYGAGGWAMPIDSEPFGWIGSQVWTSGASESDSLGPLTEEHQSDSIVSSNIKLIFGDTGNPVHTMNYAASSWFIVHFG